MDVKISQVEFNKLHSAINSRFTYKQNIHKLVSNTKKISAFIHKDSNTFHLVFLHRLRSSKNQRILHPLYSRPNKLTSPRPKLRQFLRFYKTVHRTILQKEKPTHDRFTLNTSVSSSDLNGHIQLWQIADSLQSEGIY